MHSLNLRPRFSKFLKLKPQEIINRVRTFQKKQDGQIQATIINHRVNFNFLPEHQHYWSPQLSFELIGKNEGTLLRGLFGPSPKVWSLFLFLYSGFGLIGLVGLLFGMAQWNLNINPTGLWILLASMLMEIIFYLIARTGKKLASKQMKLLREGLDSILFTAIEKP